MSNEQMDNLLLPIFERVFRIAPLQYSDALSPDTLRDWDSFGHIRLVSAMEEILCVKFELVEIMDMLSVRAIKDILARRGVDG